MPDTGRHLTFDKSFIIYKNRVFRYAINILHTGASVGLLNTPKHGFLDFFWRVSARTLVVVLFDWGWESLTNQTIFYFSFLFLPYLRSLCLLDGLLQRAVCAVFVRNQSDIGSNILEHLPGSALRSWASLPWCRQRPSGQDRRSTQSVVHHDLRSAEYLGEFPL